MISKFSYYASSLRHFLGNMFKMCFPLQIVTKYNTKVFVRIAVTDWNFVYRYFKIWFSIFVMWDYHKFGFCVAGPTPRGGIPGPCPQMTACAPPKENCASPTEDCAPKKLTGSGLLECKFGVYRPYFRYFCGLTPDFIKLLRRRLFFFCLHLRILEKLQEFWDDNQNLWKFLYWRPFFLAFTFFVWSTLE